MNRRRSISLLAVIALCSTAMAQDVVIDIQNDSHADAADKRFEEAIGEIRKDSVGSSPRHLTNPQAESPPPSRSLLQRMKELKSSWAKGFNKSKNVTKFGETPKAVKKKPSKKSSGKKKNSGKKGSSKKKKGKR